MNLKIEPWKLPKLKCRESNRKNIQKLWDHFKNFNIGVMEILEEKENRAKEIMK